LWNPKKKLLLKKYDGHHSDVLDAVSSNDNANIVSGGTDKTVILWDVSSSEPVRRMRGHYGNVNCVSFNADSSVVLSASNDHSVRIWDVRSMGREPVQVLDEARDSVTSIAVSDHEIVTGSMDCKVRRYDLRVGIMNMDDVKAAVSSCNFTRDGQCILCNCLNNSLKLIDKETGSILQEFRGHVNAQFRLDSCLLKNDEIVLSGSEDGAVYAWNLTQV
jgi:mitogen-activated protein kinase organizer 1